MRVRVLYFGVLKDLFGAERDAVELPDQSSVADLLALIGSRKLTLPGLWKTIAVAVNQEYVLGAAVLHDDDEVALLPPVSGGREEGCTDAG